MANVFDQFDSSSGNVFDQFDEAQPKTYVKPGDVAGAKALFEKQAAAEPRNVVRERQTISGELTGGLGQVGDSIKRAITEPSSLLNPIKAAANALQGKASLNDMLDSPQAQALLGMIRVAAPILSFGTSPTIANVASAAGEAASDALAKRGFTTAADIVGGVTQAGVDVLGGLGTARAAGAVAPLIRNKLPLVGERLSKLGAENKTAADAINAEAATARQQALNAQRSITSDTEAALAREASIGDRAKQYARERAAQQQASLPTAEKARALVNTDATSEDIGRAFKEQTYAPKQAASKSLFGKAYGEIEDQGKNVPVNASKYEAAADKIYGKPEAGVSRPNPTQAERAAGGAKRALDIEDEHYNDLVQRAENAKRQGLDNAEVLEQAVKEERARLPEQPTFTDLMHERARLRAAERRAYDTGNGNLGRQYEELQQAIGQDLRSADEGLGNKLSGVDKRYAAEHVPFFGAKSEIRKAAEVGNEAVLDKLIPTAKDPNRVAKMERLQSFVSDPASKEAIGDGFLQNMIGDAMKLGEGGFSPRIQSQWAKYADSRTENMVLKSVLGERYAPMKEIVEQTRSIKPKTITAQLKSALKDIEQNTSLRSAEIDRARLKSMGTLEGALGEGEKLIGDFKVAAKPGSIESTRLQRLDDLEKEFRAKAEKLGIRQIPEHGGQLVGTAMVLHGLVGGVMGNPAALSQVMSGGIVLMSAPGVMRLTNTTRGLELFKRLTRAVPGTVQAAAQARLVQNYLNTGK